MGTVRRAVRREPTRRSERSEGARSANDGPHGAPDTRERSERNPTVSETSQPVARGRWRDHHVPMTEGTAGEVPGDVAGDLLTAIDHVGIAVPDLDAAIAFHRDVLGMRVTHEETNVEQGVREAMLAVGYDDHGAGARVQLLAPISPDSPIARFLDRSGPGLQQVAYRVAELDTVCARLRERGLRLLYDEPRRGTAGSRINFVHPKDAGGVLVELVEPARPEQE